MSIGKEASFVELMVNPFSFGPSSGAWGDVTTIAMFDTPSGGKPIWTVQLPDALRVASAGVAINGSAILLLDLSTEYQSPSEDGEFVKGTDFGIFAAFKVFSTAAPKSTKKLDKACIANPKLKQELERLCGSYTPTELSALAEALYESVKGLVEKGANPYEVSPVVQARVQALLGQGQKSADIVRIIAPMLPSGGSLEGQWKRATRLVAELAQSPQTLMIRPEAARAIIEKARTHPDRTKFGS